MRAHFPPSSRHAVAISGHPVAARWKLAVSALAAAAVLTVVASPAEAAVSSSEAKAIRNIDFRNGFTFEGGYGPIVVEGGTYSDDREDTREYFEVRDIDFGDLDGDGREEAIVTTLSNTGGTGQFTDGLIFSMRSARPRIIASLGVGDRADGGIADVAVVSNRIVVDRFGQDQSGACCPEYVERATLILRVGKLLPVSGRTRRAYIDISQIDQPAEIKFLKGTSSATIVGVADGQLTGAFFAARAGQTVTLTVAPASIGDPTATVTLRQRGARVTSTSSGKTLRTKLPVTGEYQIVLSAPGADPSAPPFMRFDLEIR